MVLRLKRTHGFECSDQTGSATDKRVSQCTEHPQSRKHALHKCHAPRAPSSQHHVVVFFHESTSNKGPTKKSLSSVANSPSSRRSTNCLQIVHTDVVGRFLGPLPQVCIGRGSWHDRDATDKRKAHQHNERQVQQGEKVARARAEGNEHE